MCDKINNLSPSFGHYCYLSEAIAPYHSASTSTGTASKPTSFDVMQAHSSPLMEGDNKSHFEQMNASSSDKRRRKAADASSSLTSPHLKNSNGEKSRKQKNKKEEEIIKAKIEAAPNGYIHVRARRGQATDNHSLAERVRREKISERMKVLQSLVPGCDKVTGKAHMLDEIINYVQSLQNQVEFLSMRLASTNPMIFEYVAHLDEIERIGPLANGQVSHVDQYNQSNNVGPRATALDYQMFFNASLSSLLQSDAVGPTTSFSQDDCSEAVMVQVGEQEQEGFSSQLGFDNIFSPTFD